MGNPLFESKAVQGQFGAQPSQGVTTAASATTAAMSSQQLEQVFNQPSATPQQTERMTYDDVIMRTLGSLGVVVLFAAVPLMIVPQFASPLMWVGVIGGLVLGLVNSFKKEPVPALILGYAAFQGLLAGGLTYVLDTLYPGVAMQALIGTFSVLAATLILFKFAQVRATPKATKIFMVLIAGYLIFSVVNLVLMLTGAQTEMFGLRSSVTIMGIPLGVLLGVFAILLGAFSLIMDFTMIEKGIENGAPRRYSWTAAFGLTVSLVWIYVEFLRLFAILNNRN